MQHSQSFRPPADGAGHLYYVRLKTNFGPMYKLGFTSLSSVEERFGFKNNGDERLLDRKFLFAQHNDALAVEQRLHGHFWKQRIFGRFSAERGLPLYQNGQSELYVEDVLRLDPSYTDGQAKETKERLRRADAIGEAGIPKWWTFLIYAIGTPLRLFFGGIWLVLCGLEALLDHFGKVAPAKRGTLFGSPFRTVPAKENAAGTAEIAPLLDWIRANRIDMAIEHMAVRMPASDRSEGGFSATRASSNKQATEHLITPAAALGRRLVDLVPNTRLDASSAWGKLAEDIASARQSIMGDPTLHMAACYGLAVSSAKRYLDGEIKSWQFDSDADLLAFGSRAPDADLVDVYAQFDELARRYGIAMSPEHGSLIVTAALSNQENLSLGKRRMRTITAQVARRNQLPA